MTPDDYAWYGYAWFAGRATDRIDMHSLFDRMDPLRVDERERFCERLSIDRLTVDHEWSVKPETWGEP